MPTTFTPSSWCWKMSEPPKMPFIRQKLAYFPFFLQSCPLPAIVFSCFTMCDRNSGIEVGYNLQADQQAGQVFASGCTHVHYLHHQQLLLCPANSIHDNKRLAGEIVPGSRCLACRSCSQQNSPPAPQHSLCHLWLSHRGEVSPVAGLAF